MELININRFPFVTIVTLRRRKGMEANVTYHTSLFLRLIAIQTKSGFVGIIKRALKHVPSMP